MFLMTIDLHKDYNMDSWKFVKQDITAYGFLIGFVMLEMIWIMSKKHFFGLME